MNGMQIVEKAKTYKGKYAKHINKFTKHFAGRYNVNKNGYYKAGYCTLFVMYVYDVLGILSWFPKKSDNTNVIYKYLKKNGKIITDPKKARAGMPAFKKVGSTSKKSSGHTSIFWKYENGYVYTIDGNVSGGVIVRKKKPAWYLGFGNILKETPAPKPLPKPTKRFKTGTTYTLLEDMTVRKGAGTNQAIVKPSEMTADARKHLNSKGELKAGTRVTCKGSKLDSKGAEWILTPSGYICGRGSTGKLFIK